jgi:hypothetical protein
MAKTRLLRTRIPLVVWDYKGDQDDTPREAGECLAWCGNGELIAEAFSIRPPTAKFDSAVGSLLHHRALSRRGLPTLHKWSSTSAPTGDSSSPERK